MYLAAQRVRTMGGQEGINAFHYVHGYAWPWPHLPPPTVPDEDPGVLVGELTEVPPAQNVVRSYLDIVAADDAFWPEIRPAFFTFVSEAQRHPFPWDGYVGRCYFRVGLDRLLAQHWRVEVPTLYRALERVYPAVLL